MPALSKYGNIYYQAAHLLVFFMRFDIDPNPSKSCKRSLGEASSHEVILLFKQARNFGDYLRSKTLQAKGKIWSAALANTPKNHVKMQQYSSSDKAVSSNQSDKFNLLMETYSTTRTVEAFSGQILDLWITSSQPNSVNMNPHRSFYVAKR